MNLLLIDPVDIPFGGAHSMHVSLFIKGLRAHTVNAVLIIPYGSKRESQTSSKKNTGHYEGVPYFIVQQSRKVNKFLSFIYKCIGVVKTTMLLYKRNQKRKIDAVIIGGIPDLIRDCPIILLCLLLRIPFYPWFVEKMSLSKDYYGLAGFLNKYSQQITENILPRICTGVIVISTLLQKFYLRYLPERKILLNPILVSDDLYFKNNNQHYQEVKERLDFIYKNKKFLVYSGSFAEKDGIYHLIEAFHLIHKMHPELIFVMTGRNPDENIMKRVEGHIRKFNLENIVKLLGFVHSDELLYLNQNAEILFVCRTSSSFANYGFPWKLGEYCMTEKPIIATRVGDIEQYFTDQENMYIVQPDNPYVIADKICYIIENYNDALRVAKKGKETALQCFNYLLKTKDVVQFITKKDTTENSTYSPKQCTQIINNATAEVKV